MTSPNARFTWPEQIIGDGVRKSGGSRIRWLEESGFAGLVDIDGEARSLALRWGGKLAEAGYLPRALTRDDWSRPGAQTHRSGRIGPRGRWWVDPEQARAQPGCPWPC